MGWKDFFLREFFPRGILSGRFFPRGPLSWGRFFPRTIGYFGR